MGEVAFGAGRSGQRVLTVTIGTGLGACLTERGRVVEVVGGLEIEKLAQRPTAGGRADDVLSARGLADAARRRDGGACRAAPARLVSQRRSATMGERLGEFLAPVVDELRVDLVVVGGGLVNAFDVLGPELRAALGPTRCEPALLGAAGPLLGRRDLPSPTVSQRRGDGGPVTVSGCRRRGTVRSWIRRAGR